MTPILIAIGLASGSAALAGPLVSSLHAGGPPAGSCPCTIFASSATPSGVVATGAPLEVGVKFRSEVSGTVTGVRFFKDVQDSGHHVGKLWSSTGLLLASVTFSHETPSGWQQESFSSPVPIAKDTIYVVSYDSPTGVHESQEGFFAGRGQDSRPLHALADGSDGPNGVYAPDPNRFPRTSGHASNYWVDVVLATSSPIPTTVPQPPPTTSPSTTPPTTSSTLPQPPPTTSPSTTPPTTSSTVPQGPPPTSSPSTSTTVTSPTAPAGPVPTCSWALPDMSRNAADPFHYADANGNSSDDPLQTPSPVPCTLVGAAPWQADNARHIVQVRPNVRDTPTLRSIELWGEVAAPAGSGTIDRVWWTVLHPDGTHAAKVEGLLQVPSACAGPVGMFAAAKRTGQLSEAAVDEPIAGLVALCQSGADRLFHGMMTVSSKEPCGEYRVELHALAQGVEAVLASYVDVQCFIALDTNFATVNWGNISPGAAQVVQGGATLQSSGPAIENQGNAGVGFMVAFSPLVQANTQGQPIARSKAITSFGARFGAGGEHLQVVDPIEAGSPVSLGDGPYQVLCNGEVGALDLILHPGTQLAAGVYVGALTVIARAVAGNGQGNHQASADPHNKAVGLCYEDQGQIVPPAPP